MGRVHGAAREATGMSDGQSQESVRSRLLILGGIAFLGVAGCLGMYHAFVVWEQGRREADFRLLVQQRFHTIEKHVRSTMEAVEAVGAFFQASEYVDPEEFKTFTHPLLAKHPGLHELGWASGRVAFREKSPSEPPVGNNPAPEDGLASPESKQPASSPSEPPEDGQKITAPPFESKGLKVQYLEASQPPLFKRGMDLSSLRGIEPILRQMHQAGQEPAIGRVWLESGNSAPPWVFLICVPVSRSYSPHLSPESSSGESASSDRPPGMPAGKDRLAPSATSEGVVFGVSLADVLIEQALSGMASRGIELYWYEGLAEENGELLYYRPAWKKGDGATPLAGPELVRRLHECRAMEVLGQPWRLYWVPTAAYLAEGSSPVPELMLMGGLSALCVVLAYVHALLSRQAQVRQVVQSRTAELQKAKEALELRERSLRDSQAMYSSLVEGLPLAVLRKNCQGQFTFANQAFCRLLKRPLEEILGKTDFDFYPSDLAEKYQADDRRVMETGEFWDTVEENIQDGIRKYVQVMKFPVRDAVGQIVGVQVIFWDVTDRKRTEMALEKERALLHTLMDHLPHNIYFKDRQSRFIRINRAMARYFGLAQPSEAEGKTDFDFFTREHAEQALADERYILATGRPILNKEEKETWPDGNVTWVSTTKLPLWDAEGAIIGTYGISRDITGQKLAAEALKAAKEAAEAANLAKSQFLANVSHEIRTPLHALLGLTELVLEGPLEPAQRAYLEMIQDAGENLLMVLNDLLDFSKIEAGHLELEHIPFCLRELVGETLKSFAFLAHGKGLELVWHIRPDVPEAFLGDPLRVRQVLSNLVGNAIKFTDEGEICTEVFCTDRQSDSVVLHFQVRDTGIGIPPDKLETIFEMFEQADKSTRRKYGGTGLGLSICSRLVASMQGRIWAESQVGQGSCFQFTARFELASEVPPRPSPEQLALLQHCRILVMEPHPIERQNLEGLLGSWGTQVTCVSTLAEAKVRWQAAASENAPFTVVLSASTLPEVEGSELANVLAEWSQLGCRVIRVLPAGCRAYEAANPAGSVRYGTLIKPYKPSELLDILLWAVGGGLAEPPRARPAEPVSPVLLPPLRILVAEDSAVGQQLAVGILERYGHKVTVVRTGREAVTAVQTQPFDLVLMDLHMPEMDGWEATQAIRTWEKKTGGHVPIVAMTAHDLSEEIAQVRDHGMDHFICKPIRVRQLFQVISEVLPKSEKSTEPPEKALDSEEASALGRPTYPLENSSTSEKALDSEEASAPASVDWQAAHQAVRGDRRLLLAVVETLLEEAPRLMEAVREAVAASDARRLHLAAHTLKGSVRIFGNTPVYQEAWAIERLALAGGFPSPETVQKLEGAVSQLLRELMPLVEASPDKGSSYA